MSKKRDQAMVTVKPRVKVFVVTLYTKIICHPECLLHLMIPPRGDALQAFGMCQTPRQRPTVCLGGSKVMRCSDLILEWKLKILLIPYSSVALVTASWFATWQALTQS